MSNVLIDMLAINVSNFIAVTEHINRRQNDLLPAEKEAYPALRDFWRYNMYNPEECKILLEKMTKAKSKRPASDFTVVLQDFRRLCFDYYTKDKAVFEAFQKSLSKSSGQQLQPKPQTQPFQQSQPIPKPQQQPQHQPQNIQKTNKSNVYNYSDGSYFTGKIKNNQPNGNGRRVFANGSWQEGFFINGKLFGNGRSYDSNLKRLAKGYFEDDILKRKILYKWANGDIFKGYAENNANILAHGTYFIKDRDAEAGSFVNDKWIKGANRQQKFTNWFWKYVWLFPILIGIYFFIIQILQDNIDDGFFGGLYSFMASIILIPVIWNLRNWITTFPQSVKRKILIIIGVIIGIILFIDIIKVMISFSQRL